VGDEEKSDTRQVKTDPDEPRNLRDMLDTSPLIKAHFIDRGNLPTSNVIEAGVSNRFSTHGALVPPFEPDDLCALYRVSNSLRPNIDAYQTNIDGFGHRFEPVINLESEDADERIKNALFLESLHDKGVDPREAMSEDVGELIPTDEDVGKAKEEIKLQMQLEKAWLKNFFDFCCPDISFSELRQRSRQDREVIGWGTWEALRNDGGEVVQFNYLPAFSIRLMPLDDPVEVEMRVRISDLSFEDVAVQRRFRRFIQVFEDREVFFKEFGDPRVISKKTGKVMPTNEEGKAEFEDESDGPATELLYFPIHNPESAYGVPRWIGNLLSVIGSRQSEEVNFLYFDGKGVPPMALLISGGKLSGNSVERIKDFIQNNIKGRKNFHSVMVLEAETVSSKASENSGRVKIEMKPLTAAQHNDALFQNYDERNIDKVGMSFRLPRMLRGDIRDFNRATADAALAFAEMQVFQPEREDFDFMINRRLLLNEFGIRYWKYVSNAPVTRDPAVVAKMIKDLMNSNAVTALDMRPLLEEVFNREFRTITADWAKQPVPLTVAGIQTGEDGEIVTEDEGEDPDATPEAEAEAFGDMLDLLEQGGGELLDMADLTTGGPGTRAPAQGGPFGGPFSNAPGARRFRRLRPQIKSNIERVLASYELDRQAIALIKLREVLKKATEAEAERELTGGDATD
jgi:PBSX family phage portal protein